MTLQDLLSEAEKLPLADQLHLISHLAQRLESNAAFSTPSDYQVTTAAVGLIADLIQNPIPFEDVPLTRDQIYDR